MPAGPGESLLTTVFADVHYYFNDPASRPLHHRFDRGSYVYLYHNATQRQSKLEIANAAGTPNQDAFNGSLNLAHIRWSYLQPNLLTLLINTAAVQDHTTWHLPSFDLGNEQRYLHKIHALDVYLWTEKDATNLLNQLKAVIGADRMELKENPASKSQAIAHEHRDSMSPAVQQLERTANYSNFSQRSASTVSAASFPGPPTPAAVATAPIASPQPVVGGYNPAAPPAPEPVTYREKTPPPPDDGTGTGLKNASRYDAVPQQYPMSPGFAPQHANIGQQSTPQPGFPNAYGGQYAATRPGPPSSAPSFGPMATSTISSPAPSQHAASPPPSQFQQPSQQFANYPAHLQQQQYGNYPGTPGYNPNLPPTPSAPPAYAASGNPHQPLSFAGPPQHTSPPPSGPSFPLSSASPASSGFSGPPQQSSPPPVGGYSNYSYTSGAAEQPAHSGAGAYTGDTHTQLYRPTEDESKHSHGKPKKQKEGGPKAVDKLEGKVSGLISRLDKLW